MEKQKFKHVFDKKLADSYASGQIPTIPWLMCQFQSPIERLKSFTREHMETMHTLHSCKKQTLQSIFGPPSRKKLPFEGSPSLHIFKYSNNNIKALVLHFGDSKTSSNGSNFEIVKDDNLSAKDYATISSEFVDFMVQNINHHSIQV